ncbi:transcriptional regulator/sugar kinase [Microbacterium testaceum StLB037]|uniref:Transcriptional regulator/sugar kinase n=1 Tax=Microbacterium testaceum (strain StLB037) TaxID=979556 RepID=E8NGI1_MICTS|nr:ROK family transcriptional regulator [Microbacterium testaceum]BAJ74064.1 transcriptional regulator/sugar kinase [Microbacterium testaceum StLB037]
MPGKTTSVSTPALVLDVIRTRGPISRIELAEATGLTAASMTTAVRQLIEKRLVLSVGHGESTGGKRRELLDVNPTTRFGLGLQLGPESMQVVVANLWGAVVGRVGVALAPGATPDETLGSMSSAVEELLATTSLADGRIEGLCVAVPGPHEASGAIVDTPSLAAWEGYPLGSALEAATGIGVRLENAGLLSAAGEVWTGAAGDSRALAAIHVDGEISAGVAVDGRLVRGSRGRAGDIRHLPIDPAGPLCRCGQRGCLAVTGTPEAIASRYQDETGSRLTPGRIAARVESDPRAARAVDDAVTAFSRGIVAFADALDLDRLVLSGRGYGRLLDRYLDGVRDHARALGRTHLAVAVSANQRDAGAVAAAGAVLRDHIAAR